MKKKKYCPSLVDINGFLLQMEKHTKNDDDVWLDNNECIMLYAYITDIRTQLKDFVELSKEMAFNSINKKDIDYDSYVNRFLKRLIKYDYIEKDDNDNYVETEYVMDVEEL